jgi:hypothetical protein
MFIEELKPVVTELTKQPIAFMGGFVSGVLKLNPSEEPLKSWLEKQGNFTVNTESKKMDLKLLPLIKN